MHENQGRESSSTVDLRYLPSVKSPKHKPGQASTSPGEPSSLVRAIRATLSNRLARSLVVHWEESQRGSREPIQLRKPAEKCPPGPRLRIGAGKSRSRAAVGLPPLLTRRPEAAGSCSARSLTGHRRLQQSAAAQTDQSQPSHRPFARRFADWTDLDWAGSCVGSDHPSITKCTLIQTRRHAALFALGDNAGPVSSRRFQHCVAAAGRFHRRRQ